LHGPLDREIVGRKPVRMACKQSVKTSNVAVYFDVDKTGDGFPAFAVGDVGALTVVSIQNS